MSRLPGRHILIRVNGSHAIGLGHVYRMKTLALALQEAGTQVAFLTQADPTTNRLLESTRLRCFSFQLDGYESIRQEAIREHRPDVIIQDVLATSSAEMADLRRLTAAKIVNLDDIGAGLAMADVVINSLVFHWGKYKADESRARLFEGPQYMILHSAIRDYASQKKNIAERAEKVLLAFGGTDTHFVTERALQAVNTIETSLKVTINIGPGSTSTSGLEQAVETSPHGVRVLRAAPDLFNEFCQADVVVCAGGNMLYELAAMGVPAVSIPAEPHEIYNVNYWAGVGTTVGLEWEKHLDPTQVSEAVGRLLPDRQRRFEMSEAGKRLMDTCGLDRVVGIIGEALN